MNSGDAIEVYRSLHATIKHASGEQPVRSVLVVDVDRKSPSSVGENLARAFVRAGDRCLLVDANLRDGADFEAGLTDLIAGEAPVDADPVGDAGGLPRMGPGRRQDPDLLARDALGATLQRLRADYDYLVMTCAPLPAYGDAVALAARVDAVVLVISAGVTGREAAIRARDALERVGARILGMVMVERPRRWI